MIWMLFADVFPESLEESRPGVSATVAVLAFTTMLAVQRGWVAASADGVRNGRAWTRGGAHRTEIDTR